MATVERKLAKPIHYPESDGKPIGETFLHRMNLTGLIEMLAEYYGNEDPLVYISGNMFLYFVEGDPKQVVCPDVFLAKGVGQRLRNVYCTWLEGGKGPDLVVELTSKKTRKEDAGKKFLIYQDVLRVPEYFRFDPLNEYLKPPLQGHRLVDGVYVPIEPVEGRLPSEVTGLHFFRDGNDLKVHDPATGQTFLTIEERRLARKRSRELLDDQAQQTEAERTRAEAERTRAEAERTRAEAERARADSAEALAQAERARADQVGSELDRLRRELEELRKLQGGA